MLPTKGFFKDIDCPYHDRTCGRPYCHFRHRKKTEVAAASTSSAPSAVPTYKPTPKSELAGNRSHIPISYIPDVVRTAGPRRQSYNLQDRPTYKPTPKSVLSVVNKDNASAETPKTYTPTPIEQLKDVQGTEINLDEEFKLIDEILSECAEDIQESNVQEDENDKGDSKETCDISKAKTVKSDQNSVVSTTEDKKKSSKEKDKDKDREKEKSRDDRSKDRHKDKEKDRKSDKHKSDRERDKEKDKDKDKDRKSSSSSSRSSRSDKRSSSSSSRSKSSSHSTSSNSKSSSKSSSSHKDKDRDKHRSSSSSSKHKSDSKSEKNSKSSEKSASVTDFLNDADDFFDDDIDMDSTNIEDECLKIFNDYKAPEVETLQPPEPLKVLVPEEEPKDEVFHGGKKRIAYNNAVKDEVKARPAHKSVMSAGMTLQNRIRIAHQAQANNEAQGIMTEVKSYKRTAHVPSNKAAGDAKRARPNGASPEKAKQPAKAPQEKLPSTSVIDDILNAKSTTVAGTTLPPSSTVNSKPPMRRFAPASNVMSIQQAKARIDEIRSRTVQAGRTSATTVAKGAKRAAHVPDLSLNNIPDVLQAERSKLPVNVRTRYLCLLADECVKLYVSTEEAYNRALNEEFKCYERCKALPTYRNSAMLAVNRLRKEVQEREAAGLGPLQVGEVHGKSSDSHLEGKKFYEHIKSFLLSDEELIQHGFPREGPTPGRAVINNEYKQQHTSEHLDENQRLCCRCHKIYPINRDGFPLFEEECCYHPMRKRTIRGERMYLCCKSSEDTGCAVSGTHVSEVSADRELEGFQSTFESEREDDPRDHAVYALDCEMCYTTKGLELTRVTVVNSKLKTVYESLVKPINPIIDYNTRFSGITAEHMENTTTNILQIQATILHLCSSKTILIGHSLESDMKALKIIHNSVVDTSVMFPHKFGLPHKRALRVLASEYLKKIIQNDVGGHDSAEDALAAMELVLWKVKEDLKVKGIKA